MVKNIKTKIQKRWPTTLSFSRLSRFLQLKSKRKNWLFESSNFNLYPDVGKDFEAASVRPLFPTKATEQTSDCGGGGGVCCGRMVHVTLLLAFLLPGLGEYT